MTKLSRDIAAFNKAVEDAALENLNLEPSKEFNFGRWSWRVPIKYQIPQFEWTYLSKWNFKIHDNPTQHD